jgi:hypothetical protein
MKTLTETIYTFSELPKDAQQKAISNYLDINTEFNWWDDFKNDLEDIGCELVGFDIYYDKIEIYFNKDLEIIADNILFNYGESTKIYKIALIYLKDKNEDIFKNNVTRYFIKEIKNLYEYLISDEAIAETFEANDYHFDLKGKIKG